MFPTSQYKRSQMCINYDEAHTLSGHFHLVCFSTDFIYLLNQGFHSSNICKCIHPQKKARFPLTPHNKTYPRFRPSSKLRRVSVTPAAPATLSDVRTAPSIPIEDIKNSGELLSCDEMLPLISKSTPFRPPEAATFPQSLP